MNPLNLLDPQLILILAVLGGGALFALVLAVVAFTKNYNVTNPIAPPNPTPPAVTTSSQPVLGFALSLLTIVLGGLMIWLVYGALNKQPSTSLVSTDAELVTKKEAAEAALKKAETDHAKLTEVLKEAKLPDGDAGKLKEKRPESAKTAEKLRRIVKVLRDHSLTSDEDKLAGDIKLKMFTAKTVPVAKSTPGAMKTAAEVRAEEIDDAKKKVASLRKKAQKAGFLVSSEDELPMNAITFPVHNKLVGPTMLAEVKKGLRPETDIKIKNISVFMTEGHTINAFYVTYQPVYKGVELADETKVFTGITTYTAKKTAEWADLVGLMMDVGRIGRSITPEDPPAAMPPGKKDCPLFELPLP